MIRDKVLIFLSQEDISQGRISIQNKVAEEVHKFIFSRYDMFVLVYINCNIISTYPAEALTGQYIEVEFILRENVEIENDLLKTEERLTIGL